MTHSDSTLRNRWQHTSSAPKKNCMVACKNPGLASNVTFSFKVLKTRMSIKSRMDTGKGNTLQNTEAAQALVTRRFVQ